MSGLFGTMNVGKSGIFASQHAIDTTSHNIANANTEGYSRQRAKFETTRPFCTPAFNNDIGPGQVGTGVQVSEIERIRDAFIDYQVRVELGTQGDYSAREKFLTELEGIFNEPSDSGISDILGNFFNSWEDLVSDAQTSSTRKLVAEQTNALCNELNHKFDQFKALKGNAQSNIKQSLFDANSMLNQIKKLNEEIVQVSVAGNSPNDLLDKRDLFLDKLSSKFGIKIEKTKLNGIDVSTKGDPSAKPPGEINIVQRMKPDDVARFAYVDKIEPKEKQNLGEAGEYTVTYYKFGDKTSEDNKMTLTLKISDDKDLSKEGSMTAKEKFQKLDQFRAIWTDDKGVALKNTKDKELIGKDVINFEELAIFTPSSGDIHGLAEVQKEVDNNIEQMNKLAKAIAFAVNAVHSQTSDIKKDDLPFFVNGDVAKYDEDKLINKDETLNSEEGINAGNISINKEILKDPMLIKTGKTKDNGENDGVRALAIADLRHTLMEIQNIRVSYNSRSKKDRTNRETFINNLCEGLKDGEHGVKIIKGSTGGMKIDNFFKDTVNKLGVQTQEAKKRVKGQYTVLAGFEQRRASVSGVSMDEEMVNLVKLQHSYQANSKIISTVDQLLDVVINGLKR